VEDGNYAGRWLPKHRFAESDLVNLNESNAQRVALNVTRFVPEKRKKPEPTHDASKQKHPIAKDHPWRRAQTAAEKFGCTTSDREILSILEDAFLK
jgi:hypothetical protein